MDRTPLLLITHPFVRRSQQVMSPITINAMLLTLMFLSSASCRTKNGKDTDVSEGNSKFMELKEMAIELEKHYQSVEEDIRVTNGITDQKKIDSMMQLLIDEGDINTPFIINTKEGIPQMVYVSYSEYKNYYSSHAIDTASVFIIQIDSIEINEESDTIK